MLTEVLDPDSLAEVLAGTFPPDPAGVSPRQLAWTLWWFELADFADLFTAWWRCGAQTDDFWEVPTILTGYARGGPSRDALLRAGVSPATMAAVNDSALAAREASGMGAGGETIGMFTADDAGPDFDPASPLSLCLLFDNFGTGEALDAERDAAVVWPLVAPTLLQNAVLASPRLNHFLNTDASDEVRALFGYPRPNPWNRWQRAFNTVVRFRRPAHPRPPAPPES